MKIKRAGYLLAIFLFLMAPAYAQERPEADSIIAKMETVLKLTPQQIDLLRPIIKEYTAKRHQIIQNFKDTGTVDKSILYAKIKQLNEEENKSLSQILSQAQMKQWADHQALTQIMNRGRQGDITDNLDVYTQGGMAF